MNYVFTAALFVGAVGFAVAAKGGGGLYIAGAVICACYFGAMTERLRR